MNCDPDINSLRSLPSWFADSRLWLVTDQSTCAPLTIPEVLCEVLPAGIDVVVLRMKGAEKQSIKDTAVKCREVCSMFSVPLVVSHDIGLAIEVDAEAVHLGQGDGSVTNLAKSWPDSLLAGYSTHSPAEAICALDAGFDYVFLGPIYPSPEKLKYGDPLGPDTIEEMSSCNNRIVYIGGMDTSTIKLSASLGARKFAAIGISRNHHSLLNEFAISNQFCSKWISGSSLPRTP